MDRRETRIAVTNVKNRPRVDGVKIVEDGAAILVVEIVAGCAWRPVAVRAVEALTDHDPAEQALPVVDRVVGARGDAVIMIRLLAGTEQVIIRSIGRGCLVGQGVIAEDVLPDRADAAGGQNVAGEGLAAETAVGCRSGGGRIVDLILAPQREERGKISTAFRHGRHGVDRRLRRVFSSDSLISEEEECGGSCEPVHRYLRLRVVEQVSGLGAAFIIEKEVGVEVRVLKVIIPSASETGSFRTSARLSTHPTRRMTPRRHRRSTFGLCIPEQLDLREGAGLVPS